ncbi:hypothetical protein [Devosia sp. SD17-2]|uniref:hypothetical protein n=1 Tax=Devosia sp. SD17-2 TaxID=2976459 RepID=UPI0023D84637|nr:hypothetical protein [Devosia sp. SD17-2]WEJ31690.1 hypothetical protein NYQ88_12325 [Devosia sp. SD17-2]
MHVSDGELGLAMAMGSRLRADQRAHQSAIAQKDSDIALLTAALRRARAELEEERAKRLLAETKLEDLLDTVI